VYCCNTLHIHFTLRVYLTQFEAVTLGEFKHEVRQFEKSYDNQQA